MPIDKVTSTQFQDQIRTAITDRAATHDTAYGPIKDIVIDPMAVVLERQNDRIRTVSLLISLTNSSSFTEADLDALVYNEGMIRIQGAKASATVVFSRSTAPTVDVVVQRGFPIATQTSEASGSAVTFVTTEARTMFASTAASYFNLNTQRYELQVPVESIIEGSSGIVGPSRINRPLRPLTFFDSVTNTASSVGGRDRETNDELIQRYLIAILGREISTPDGVAKYARDNFPDVTDLLTVYGANPLMIRAASEAGAVDAYVIGEQLTTQTDNVTYLGVGQLIPITLPPLVAVNSVVRVASSTTYTEGTDYSVVFDASGNGRSERAIEGIKFLLQTPPLVPGDLIAITYTYNNLIRNLQTGFEQDDTFVHGRDLLFKRGIEVDIILEAQLRVTTGFNAPSISTLVKSTVLSFVNALKLGADVENSDLQGAVRTISGVDNFIITRLVRDSTASGTTDIIIADNEFARIADVDLVLTLI
jgi:uncharacterized phage protein gp47/JayE